MYINLVQITLFYKYDENLKIGPVYQNVKDAN